MCDPTASFPGPLLISCSEYYSLSVHTCGVNTPGGFHVVDGGSHTVHTPLQIRARCKHPRPERPNKSPSVSPGPPPWPQCWGEELDLRGRSEWSSHLLRWCPPESRQNASSVPTLTPCWRGAHDRWNHGQTNFGVVCGSKPRRWGEGFVSLKVKEVKCFLTGTGHPRDGVTVSESEAQLHIHLRKNRTAEQHLQYSRGVKKKKTLFLCRLH